MIKVHTISLLSCLAVITKGIIESLGCLYLLQGWWCHEGDWRMYLAYMGSVTGEMCGTGRDMKVLTLDSGNVDELDKIMF